MKKVGILTDFASHQHAYSLCGIASNQAKMLAAAGIAYKLIVKPRFNDPSGQYPNAEVVEVDPGEIGNNVVNYTEHSGNEIESLTNQLRTSLADVGVVLTHDMIYQPNQWKYNVAGRRLAAERSDLHWYHWVHSATVYTFAHECGPFEQELRGKFPNSTLVVMHEEELTRKCHSFDYEPHEAVIIPNPVDFSEDYHPAAQEVIVKAGLWNADCVAIYPCRLDRGKQPHILIEIFSALRLRGADARIVVVDFHSITGDKADYREEMRHVASRLGVPLLFTSDLDYPNAKYELPHKAVMDLLEMADVLIHPSMSESDPLIVPEAAWKGCGLVLNFDLPLFRLYQGKALMYQFSSAIDIGTGMPGETITEYSDRPIYMNQVAAGIAYLMSTNPVLNLHAKMRKERSLYGVWNRNLWPAIGRHGPLAPVQPEEEEDDPLVSIVVPCYLLPDKDDELFRFTQDCVASIRQHMPYAELVLVNNGSPDHADWLEQHADVYVENDENLGYAGGVNRGLEVATGDWLIACNNDVTFIDDWAKGAIKAWHDDTGIISSHLLDHDPERRVGREIAPEVGYFMGALWMISRGIYDEVGGLDEGYERGMFEDKDLVQRIMASGHQLIKVGHCKHIGNATWGKLPDQAEIYQQNKERYESLWQPA